MTVPPAARGHPLWPLPLIAASLMVIAAVSAWWISVAHDYIPYCNPFVDGCVSISRAARHGLGNHIFRALMLPSATIQGATWLLCAAWLARSGATGRSLRWLPWLGIVAAIFLVVYGTFLGTEGGMYRWLRRYGTVVYFGFTYVCILIATGHIRRLVRTGALAVPARMDVMLMILAGVTMLVAIAHVFVAPMLEEQLKDRLENVVEWYIGLSFTLFFLALAWLWRHARVSLRLQD
ncbi:MAG TPA: hypothetical protein VGR01_18705 [Burkholderiales bacterium]|nr:hypothetical protein [Burkholderiales bacterium]